MKKTFKLENLCCPNCAAKMETAINKLDDVISCEINFMMLKMKLEAEDEKFDDVLEEGIKLIQRVEPDCEVVR